MDIEWFHALSITILALVATVVLIFVAVIVYRLYRASKSTLLSVKVASQNVSDSVTLVREEGIKPVLHIMAFLSKVIRAGFERISNIFRKEKGEGETWRVKR